MLILGENHSSGAYLLRIRVHHPLSIRFGKFNRGASILVPLGDYIYVGSAMGARGASSLAWRLLRHASRTDAQNPHAIRAEMLSEFEAVGLGKLPLSPPNQKKLHWHIDFLLDDRTVSLSHIIAICTATRLESNIARRLAKHPDTFALADGLGASDARGETHLFGIKNADAFWEKFCNDTRGTAREPFLH